MGRRKREAKRKEKAERKRKRKLTPEQKRARRKRRQETMIIFVRGKQRRVPRYSEPMVEGLPVDEFLRQNADEIWYWQEEDYPALAELQRRHDEIYARTFGETRFPQPEDFDEDDAPTPSEPECFDDDRLIEDECYEILNELVMKHRNDDGFCSDTERPPPPENPDEFRQDEDVSDLAEWRHLRDEIDLQSPGDDPSSVPFDWDDPRQIPF